MSLFNELTRPFNCSYMDNTIFVSSPVDKEHHLGTWSTTWFGDAMEWKFKLCSQYFATVHKHDSFHVLCTNSKILLNKHTVFQKNANPEERFGGRGNIFCWASRHDRDKNMSLGNMISSWDPSRGIFYLQSWLHLLKEEITKEWSNLQKNIHF